MKINLLNHNQAQLKTLFEKLGVVNDTSIAKLVISQRSRFAGSDPTGDCVVLRRSVSSPK